jgi:3',5'-cyclic AMP phosphodiesterase CpdA
MFTLAHFSDVHLAPLPTPRPWELMNKRIAGFINWQQRRSSMRGDVLNALVADVRTSGVDHIAITGDLTNISLPAEFARAEEWLRGVGAPEAVTVIPGNHDAYTPMVRDPGFWRWAAYMTANEAGARFLGCDEGSGQADRIFPFLRIYGEVALIGLSTAVPTFPGMSTGRLGTEQLAALDALLARLGEESFARVVLIHHPPLPGMARWERALTDAAALRTVLAARGAELVLYGHNHRFRISRLDRNGAAVPIVGAPAASLATSNPENTARYNILGVARGPDGRWRVTMRSRMYDGVGGFTEFEHGILD